MVRPKPYPLTWGLTTDQLFVQSLRIPRIYDPTRMIIVTWDVIIKPSQVYESFFDGISFSPVIRIDIDTICVYGCRDYYIMVRCLLNKRFLLIA